MPARPRTRLLAAPATLLVLVLGVWWGGHPRDLPGFMRDTLVADHQNRAVGEAIRSVLHDYYRPVSRAQLIDSSLSALVASLHDRFSSYLTPREYARFNASSRQQFSGVGMNVVDAKRGQRVVEVFDGSPAARAGIAPGDVIVAADHHSLAGLRGEGATALIKGRPGTSVVLTVVRGHSRRDVTVTRAVVSVPVVESRLRVVQGAKLAHVVLSTFSSGAHSDLSVAIQRMLRQGARGIVLDLRDNPGGLVEEARLVASEFIADGPIVTTRGRSQPTETLDAAGGAIAGAVPVVVLVNGNTASAAEIVAGAMQDRHRATVVGTHTFGKGVFQEVQPLSNGGALDITVGEYFLPGGRNLGGGGIKLGAGIRPDVTVRGGPSGVADPALAVALRVLATKLK